MGSLTGMRNINLSLTSWWLSRRETWVLGTEQTLPHLPAGAHRQPGMEEGGTHGLWGDFLIS